MKTNKKEIGTIIKDYTLPLQTTNLENKNLKIPSYHENYKINKDDLTKIQTIKEDVPRRLKLATANRETLSQIKQELLLGRYIL